MGDNVSVTGGTGNTIAADEVVDGVLGTVKVQFVKIMDGTLDGTTKATVNAVGLKVDPSGVTAPVSLASLPALAAGSNVIGALTANQSVNMSQVGGTNTAVNNGASNAGTQRVTIANDSTGQVVALASIATVTMDLAARPSNTTQYATGDNWSDSTSAPVSGGFTLANASRANGGSAQIIGLTVISNNPPATGQPLQAEIILFDTAPTNINDNSAWAVSDTEAKTIVGRIPFNLTATANNSFTSIEGLLATYNTGGATTSLRFLVRLLNDYTPASGEVLTLRFKIQYTS